MKKMFLLAAVLSSATFLVSCGGGGGSEDSMLVAAENLEVRVDATNGSEAFKALAGESVVYDGGVPEFETTTATQVDIVEAPANAEGLAFRISSDGNTATGSLEFGSCRFRITGSNYPSTLRVGTVVRIQDCFIRVATRGLPADGTEKLVTITVLLNGKPATMRVRIKINPNGVVVIRNKNFPGGIVRVRPITGTGSF